MEEYQQNYCPVDISKIPDPKQFAFEVQSDNPAINIGHPNVKVRQIVGVKHVAA